MTTEESECPIRKPSTVIEAFNEMVGFISIPHPPISEKLYDGFLLPIEYLEKSQKPTVPPHVSADLELVQLTDASASSQPNTVESGRKSMYELLCEPTHDFGKMLMPEIAKQYTPNVGFLKDTQKMIERRAAQGRRDDCPQGTQGSQMPAYAQSLRACFAPLASESKQSRGVTQEMTTKFQEVWREIKEDKSFLSKHSYMEFVMLQDLNKSRRFLQGYSLLNLVSPIYSLALPLVILILPFVLLKIWRIPITFNVYMDTLRSTSKTHFIGKLLNIREFNFENVMYVLFIGGMYIMQTYSQITTCIRYHKALQRMNENLLFLRDYLDRVSESMAQFVVTNADLPYYSDFCQDVHSHRLVLMELRERIGQGLTPYGWTIKKLTELGHMFETYYLIYSCMDYEASLRYSVGFAGYIDLIDGVTRGMKNGFLGKAQFNVLDGSGELIDTEFVKQYYPTHKHSDCVQNTVDLSANLIITGVNASGKTTTLKTTAVNILFSQQFGFGFYESAIIRPFHHIHSYLNIPDTSGRDSLFQAESRRCKEILDKIKAAPIDERHFCIFDELYSGTNPKEAAKSAHSLLKYLSQKPNVRFILTTHYVKVCRKFQKSELVKNYKMCVERKADGGFLYTYKMRAGISTLEGGIAILKNMDYPAEIINTITGN